MSRSPDAAPATRDRPIRVMVLEDDQGTREALTALLSGSPGFTCVSAHHNAEAALRAIPAEKPGVILVDQIGRASCRERV